MRRFLAVLAGLLLAVPMFGQSAQTRLALYTEISTLLPTNGTNAITAAQLRQVVNDITASSQNGLTDGTAGTLSGNNVWTGVINWQGLGNYYGTDLTQLATIVDPTLVIARDVAGSGSSDAHGISDASLITRSSNIGYASFDADVVVSGTANYNHLVGLQNRNTYSSSGTVTNWDGVLVQLRATQGSITNWNSINIIAPSVGAATVGTTYGVIVNNLAGGGATTWAFYAVSDPSFLGGIVTVNPVARSGASSPFFQVNGQGDTNIPTTVESKSVSFAGGTKTWIDGTVASQRDYFFAALTYNKTTSTATFTKAATVAINGAPVAGSGVTITTGLALWVQAGNSELDGNITSTGRILTSVSSGGIGYTTGAGTAVTQLTNRTTGVTANTPTGAITLFSAAGTATPQTFTLTDASIAATDTVTVVQKSGTDLYEIFTTTMAAGSSKITYFTTGGTTVEQPVFNFTVMKGSAN